MAHKRAITEDQFKLAKQLTALQRKFVLNIVSKGMSQRQAYIKAGGRAKTKESQDSAATQLMSNIKVKAFHDSLMKEEVSTAIMTREEILENLSEIARTSINDLVELDEDSNLKFKSTNGIPQNNARSISEITINKDGLKMKLHSSPNAMKQIVAMEGWNAATETKITGQLDLTEIKRKIVKANDRPSD